jgi:hypothetical protein
MVTGAPDEDDGTSVMLPLDARLLLQTNPGLNAGRFVALKLPE